MNLSKCLASVTLTGITLLPIANAADTAALDTPVSTYLSAPPALKTTVSLSAKETYDTNVYLQDVTASAYKHSWVSSITPSIATEYAFSPLLNSSLSYAPEINFFHSAHKENNTKHNIVGKLTGKQDNISYIWNASLLAIDGSKTDSIYTGPGGAPAIGGGERMLRRNQNWYRSNLAVSITEGAFLIRPVGSLSERYFHDYHTTTPGYQNLVNRNEFVGGLDLGYVVMPGLTPFVSYRYGHQDGENLLGVVNNFSNTINRMVIGLEGSPATWVKLNLLFGEDVRKFTTAAINIPSLHRTKFYSDSSVTLLPTKQDTITLSYVRFLQPAFVGRNGYEDITFDAQWRHTINGSYTVGLGYKENDGFYEVGSRHDHIHTYNAMLAYKFDKLTTVTLAYSYDCTTTDVPQIADTSGRNFNRNLFSLMVKCGF